MPIFKVPNQSYRWLLAELLVVVVGILIAFQVDAWRLNVKEREQEQQYLSELLEDLRDDEQQLKRSIDQRLARVPLLRRLVELLSNEATDQSFEPEIIQLEQEAYGGTAIFTSNTATYDKMQQSGEMGIVADNALYREIVDYYQRVGRAGGRDLRVDWLGRWRTMSLSLYGPLAFIQSWERGPTLTNSGLDIIVPLDEKPIKKQIDIEARKINQEYMQLLADHYQQQQLSQITWGSILDLNLALRENIRTTLNESL